MNRIDESLSWENRFKSKKLEERRGSSVAPYYNDEYIITAEQDNFKRSSLFGTRNYEIVFDFTATVDAKVDYTPSSYDYPAEFDFDVKDVELDSIEVYILDENGDEIHIEDEDKNSIIEEYRDWLIEDAKENIDSDTVFDNTDFDPAGYFNDPKYY